MKSINGWEVIPSISDKRLATGVVPGTKIKLRMHKDVLPLFLAIAADYHREVAKLRPTECGAYAYRKAAFAGAKYSDHSSGTAIDLNWNHEGAVGPNGGMKTMTAQQIKACAAIKKRYKVVIWGGDKAKGGDYSQPRFWDPMHYAIKPGTTVADVKKVIKELGIDKNGVRQGTGDKKAGIVTKVTAPLNPVVKPEAPAAPKKPVAKTKTYTVKAGDTLWSIAKANGTTVANLKKLNALTSTLIKVGQKLKVPVKG